MLSLAVVQSAETDDSSSSSEATSATANNEGVQTTVEVADSGQRGPLTGSDVAATAIVGMVIVFVVLVLITLFIQSLPRLLEAIARVLPEVPDHHAPVDTSESLLPDEPTVAAIGYVLHTELQRQGTSGDSS